MSRDVKIYSQENMTKILESLASGDLYNIPFVDKNTKKWIIGKPTGIVAKNNDKQFITKNNEFYIVRNDLTELPTGIPYESGVSVYINTANNYYYVGYNTTIGTNESGINKVSDYSYLPTSSKNNEVYICLNNYTNPSDSSVYNKGIYYYDEITGKWNTIINTDRPTAQNVTYSNSTSKINSTNVQSAIDEVYSNLKTQISNFQVLQSASGIAYDDSLSGLNASNVQDAIEAINTKVTTGDFNYASKYQKGMVKLDEDTVRVNSSNQIYVPNATSSKTGLVKPDGTTITIDSNGVISSSGGSGGSVEVDDITIKKNADGKIYADLPTAATISKLGTVRPDGISILVNADGVISASVPKATTSDVGVVKPDGTSITVDSDGVISATAGSNVEVDDITIKKNADGKIYADLPTAATNENVGLVKPDGTSITIADGVISATAPSVASTTESGTVKVDGTSITINEGVISANVTGASIGKATTDTLGAVMVDGTSITVDSDGKISSVIPTASDTTLGGVKIDNDTIVINGDGKIEVDFPEASESQKGIVQIDGSTIVLEDGVIKSTAGAGYTLPAATSTTLGGVIIDDNTIKINEDGKIYSTAQGGGNVTVDGTSITKSDDGTISAHVVDKAGVGSSGSLGGVKVDDSTIKIDENGVISVEFPTASDTVAGLIKVDNDSITINEDGQIEAKSAKALPIATTEKAGIVKIGDNLTVDSDGVLTTDLEADDIEYSNSDVTDAGQTIANTKQMLDYLNSKKDTTVTGLQNVINGTTDISFTAVTSSLTSATTIHKAIEDLDDKFNSLSGYTADRVQFDNTKSGTTMINVQNAMDELYSSVKRAEAIGSFILVDEKPTYYPAVVDESTGTVTKKAYVAYTVGGVAYTTEITSMIFKYTVAENNGKDVAITYINDSEFIIPSYSTYVQKKVMPEPTMDIQGEVYQYTGYTNSQFTNGYFYVCSSAYDNEFYYDYGTGGSFTNPCTFNLDIDLMTASRHPSDHYFTFYSVAGVSHNAENPGGNAWVSHKYVLAPGQTVTVNNESNAKAKLIIHQENPVATWKEVSFTPVGSLISATSDNLIEAKADGLYVAPLEAIEIYEVDAKPSINDDKTIVTYIKDGETKTTGNLNTWYYYSSGDRRFYLSYKDGEEFILEEDFVYSDDDIANAVEEDSGTATTINLNPVVPKIVNGEWYIGDTATGVYATTEITNIRRDENDHLVITAADGATGTDYDCGEIAAKNYYNGAVNAQNLVVSGDAMYSTAEKVVGCWIDKKPIYRKIYILESVQLLQAVQLNIEEVLNNVDTMTNLYGNINCSDGWCQSINLYESARSLNYVTYNKDTHILHYANFARQGKLYIYFEYTKTTDAENSFVPEMLQGVTVTGGAPNETFTEQEIDTMADADKF